MPFKLRPPCATPCWRLVSCPTSSPSTARREAPAPRHRNSRRAIQPNPDALPSSHPIHNRFTPDSNRKRHRRRALRVSGEQFTELVIPHSLLTSNSIVPHPTHSPHPIHKCTPDSPNPSPVYRTRNARARRFAFRQWPGLHSHTHSHPRSHPKSTLKAPACTHPSTPCSQYSLGMPARDGLRLVNSMLARLPFTLPFSEHP